MRQLFRRGVVTIATAVTVGFMWTNAMLVGHLSVPAQFGMRETCVACDATVEVPAAAAMPVRSVRRDRCKELGILSVRLVRFRYSYSNGRQSSTGELG